jgi:hypothetical protein
VLDALRGVGGLCIDEQFTHLLGQCRFAHEIVVKDEDVAPFRRFFLYLSFSLSLSVFLSLYFFLYL